MGENPLLDFLLADLRHGKAPRGSRSEMPNNSPVVVSDAVDLALAADAEFRREIELAREVCEDAEVDALTQPVPTVSLPFGKQD